ncbi:MAG TPA: HAD family phosphatase [Steroidobacteraceae bacterium]|jgi:HAD superfamily hydrolase (TIGR01509 family)
MSRAVAWDVDGTLVDSEALHHAALMVVSERYGVPIATDDERFVGVSMDQVWLLLHDAYPASLLESDWQRQVTQAYLARAPQLRAFTGALEAMTTLQQAGVPQCCVSNSARIIVTANLEAIGAAGLLAFAISRDDVQRGKPDPEPYREACRRLQLPPAQVLVVEDSETGVASGRAAGCTVLRYGAKFAGYTQVLNAVLARTV